jgi:hypothetical protein
VEDEEEGNGCLGKDVEHVVLAMEDYLSAEAHGAENASPSHTKVSGPS